MTAQLIPGPRTWKVSTDDEGYRIFHVAWLVVTNDILDGPATVLNCPGLPAAGSRWNFGNDVDSRAFRLPSQSVSIHEEKEGDPNVWWKVEQTFSTKLFNTRIKGNFKSYTKEAVKDRYGRYILTSSWEQIRGPQVEFDQNRPFVQVEQDVFNLEFGLISRMVDTVNKTGMWEHPKRCVKLSNFDWDRHLLKQNASGYCLVETLQEATTVPDDLNEIQNLSMKGFPTGGTFTIHLLGLISDPIPWDANAADVSAALVALVGANVSVTGGPFPGTDIQVEFTGAYMHTNMQLLGVNTAGLTGGSEDIDLYYYTRRMEFDIDSNTFDRKVLDEGTKCLEGSWHDITKSSAASGAGCRLILTASSTGGQILSAEIAKDPVNQDMKLAGFGYPPNDTVDLQVLTGGGFGGVITAATDALGRIDESLALVVKTPGYGYSTTSDLYTQIFPGAQGVNFYTVETAHISKVCKVRFNTQTNSDVPAPIIADGLVIDSDPGSGGEGYPAGQKIRLVITPNCPPEMVTKRVPAIITGTVDNNGVVVAVELEDGGEGFIYTLPPSFLGPERTSYSYSAWVVKTFSGKPPDPYNPQHFQRYKDREDNYARVVLDGRGSPANSIVFHEGSVRVSGDPAHIDVEFYDESDFLGELGLPGSF